MKGEINIGSWNACGLRQNTIELRHYIESENIDIMTINETKLTPDITIKIKNYTVLRRDRTAHGGGVAIAIKKSIPYQQLPSIDHVSIEHIILKITNNIFIVAVYNNPRNLFTDHDLQTLTNVGRKTLIIGDLNARHHTWKNHVTNTNGRTLFNFIINNNLTLLHTDEPTHYPHNNATPTYIDILINKNVNNLTKLTTQTALNSDHNPIKITIKNVHKDNINKKITSYKYTNWNEFRHTLDKNININNKIKNTTDIDNAIQTLTDAIIKTKHKHTRKINVNNNKLDLDNEIKDMIKTRNKLRKLHHKYKNDVIKTDVNRLNRLIRQKTKQQLNQQWEKTLQEIKPGDKALWRIAKSFKNTYETIPTMTKNNQIYMTNDEKANLIADSIESTQQNNQTSTMDDIVQETINKNLHTIDNHNIKLTSPQEIKSIIQKLPNNKAPGLDDINNKLIKNFSQKVIVQLTYIINAILVHGYYPMAWKTAVVVPIRKPNKDASDPKNYRPISLLSAISKIAEKVILSRLNEIIKNKNLIIEEQFGFREGHGSDMQVARIANAITKNYSKGNVTSMALLDIEKAFDTVWTDGIIYKLIKSGIPKAFCRLLANYLKNRKFVVKIEEKLSTTRQIGAGVPQGSVLGPTLFNLYINDIPKFAKTSLAIYADDTAVYGHSYYAQVATKQIQIHLNMILAYAKQWKIKINNNKTEHILFTKKFTNTKIFTPLNVNGMCIPVAGKVKYLGVFLDKGMSFVPHINHLVNKGLRAIRQLYPLLNRYSALSIKNKKLLYTAIIKPIITYAAPIWCSASKTQINKIQRIQNKCLRLILNANRLTKIKTLHNKTGLMTINQHVKLTATKFYKIQTKKSKLTKNMTLTETGTIQKHKYIYQTIHNQL